MEDTPTIVIGKTWRLVTDIPQDNTPEAQAFWDLYNEEDYPLFEQPSPRPRIETLGRYKSGVASFEVFREEVHDVY